MSSTIPLPGSLQEIVGSLLFASQTPLTASDLKAAVRAVEPEEGENEEIMDVYKTCTSREIDEALKGLAKALEVSGCGFSLVCAGGAWRLQTSPQCGRYVRAMLKLDRPNRLGRASLETLAIIAYRQPVTKSEIEEIRGVDVSGNIKTLLDLQLVRIVGKSELPGHPFLYGTTPVFLEHFGLASLAQLNELDPTLQRSNPRLKAASYRRRTENGAELPLGAEEKDGETAENADAGKDGKKAEAAAGEDVEETASAFAEIMSESGTDEESGSDGGDETEDEEDEFDEEEDEFDEEDEDEEDEFDEEEDDDDE